MSIAATDERDRGQPTSWSAAVDALAAGRSFDPSTQGLDYLDDGDDSARRLFVLCAGNVDETTLSVDHLDRSDTDPVHDPGQAWNALTVGAFTEKAVINDPKWASWQPVAPTGRAVAVEHDGRDLRRRVADQAGCRLRGRERREERQERGRLPVP
jgi:hypothetical protein